MDPWTVPNRTHLCDANDAALNSPDEKVLNSVDRCNVVYARLRLLELDIYLLYFSHAMQDDATPRQSTIRQS